MKICLTCDRGFEAAEWSCPACHQAPPRARDTLLFAPALAKGNGGYRAEYFQQLSELETGHFWFRNRLRLLTWALGKFFPGARRFLEVGCGTGFVLHGLSQAFPELEVAGSELFLEGLGCARNRLPGVELYQMDATRVPFADEFDVIGAFDVLEHIEADEAVLRQLYRAVKPGGGLLLTVPQHPSLWSAADARACHCRRYTRRDLLRKVETAGFKPRYVTSFVTLLLPALWAARCRRTPAESAPLTASAEFRVPAGLNACFETLLRLESWFIQRGGCLPAGGSLLLVAHKSVHTWPGAEPALRNSHTK